MLSEITCASQVAPRAASPQYGVTFGNLGMESSVLNGVRWPEIVVSCRALACSWARPSKPERGNGLGG